jgi:hypothetical protein
MKKLISIGLLSGIALACAAPASAVVLTGNYIQLGLNDGGSLIDFGSTTGIKLDPSGTSSFGAIDFLTQGTPFAFYSIGVGGTSAVAGGGPSSNRFHSVTVDATGAIGFPFAVTSRGFYGGLDLKQTVFFDYNSSTIHSTVTLTNTSHATVNNVAYGFGFDPDQDANVNGSYSTNNTIYGQGANASVSARGAASGYAVTLNNTSGWAANASIVAPSGGVYNWNTDPYQLANNAVNRGNGDNSINLGYALGDFAVGQQKTLAYDLVLTAPVPEPSTYGMMLAGLLLLRHMARRKPKDRLTA